MTNPLALRSERALRFFDWAFRRHFSGSFSALRIARWGEPVAPPGRPLIILANHPGWWDGVLVMLVTRRLFPGRPCFVPMDAAALEKYGFMRRLGVFGVEQNSARGAVRFLQIVKEVLAEPSHLLWMNAPGRFSDVRERPVPLAPGVSRLPGIAPDAVILPLAIEYTHWTEKRGETLIAFGPAIEAKDEEGIRAALTETMDRLAQDAIRRDPSLFRVVLEGSRGMGGLYGLWQRRRFAPDHDPRARQRVMEPVHIALGLALLPALFGLMNLIRLPAARGMPKPGTRVSILIPARNEAANIGICVEAALASTGCEIEVLVMDDASTDATAAIVARYPGVRLLQAPPLPPGWTGKVHACARLAEAATGTHLLFIDADVRLAPHAAAAMAARGTPMVSGVPRQRIGSMGEALTVPFINFLLLCYLPFGGRAVTRHPGFAAACGQLLLVERTAYDRAGGHAAIRTVLHDAIALARRFRQSGSDTEIVDGASLAACRMYDGFGDAWAGFLKNAREGMATPLGLPIWTVLLAGAHLWPWALLPRPEAAAAIALTFAIRAAVTWRTREPWWTVPLHPLTVLVALALQWTALVRGALGYPAGWKGRAYPGTRPA